VNPINRADVGNAMREFALDRKKGKKPMSERTDEVKGGRLI
jgi:hypothetical protein